MTSPSQWHRHHTGPTYDAYRASFRRSPGKPLHSTSPSLSRKPNSSTGGPIAKDPPALSPIVLDGQAFHPSGVVRWLGYWLTPALNTSHHFNHRLALANASFSFVKRLSSPGGGTRPFLAHRVATGLFLPILTYGADLLVPNHRTTLSMSSFWHRVCRWVTKNFYSTPTSILTREACLPPVDVYCRHRRRLAALHIAGAPPTHNPAAARLPTSFPSLSSFRAPTPRDTSRRGCPPTTSR